eukprot:758625-Hanusia_phi.AAC.2
MSVGRTARRCPAITPGYRVILRPARSKFTAGAAVSDCDRLGLGGSDSGGYRRYHMVLPYGTELSTRMIELP